MGSVTITVTAGKPAEYGFKLSRISVPLGIVVFKVVNGGKVAHNFAIAGKRTPLLAPGKSASLTVVFSNTGRYPYSSSVRGQLARGMKGVFGVVAGSSATTATASIATTASTAPTATTAVPSGPPPAAKAPYVPCANPTSSTIQVKIFDYGFTLSQNTVPCGTVTFQITNTGTIFHTFDMQSTLPCCVAAFNGGNILLGGESTTESITFTDSGVFQYECDQHWAAGMVGALTVTQ